MEEFKKEQASLSEEDLENVSGGTGNDQIIYLDTDETRASLHPDDSSLYIEGRRPEFNK